MSNPFSDVGDNINSARQLEEVDKKRVQNEENVANATVEEKEEAVRTLVTQAERNTAEARNFTVNSAIAERMEPFNQALAAAQAANQHSAAGLAAEQKAGQTLENLGGMSKLRGNVIEYLFKVGGEANEQFKKNAQSFKDNPPDNPIRRWNRRRKEGK
jgi:hypothetical protein